MDSKKIRKLSFSYIRDSLVRKNKSGNLSSEKTLENDENFGANSLENASANENLQCEGGCVGKAEARHDSSSSCSDTESCTHNTSRDKPAGLLQTLRKHLQFKSQNSEPLKFKFNSAKHNKSRANFMKTSKSSNEIYSKQNGRQKNVGLSLQNDTELDVSLQNCDLRSRNNGLKFENSRQDGVQELKSRSSVEGRLNCCTEEQGGPSAQVQGHECVCRGHVCEHEGHKVTEEADSSSGSNSSDLARNFDLDDELYTETQSVFVNLTNEAVGYETCDNMRRENSNLRSTSDTRRDNSNIPHSSTLTYDIARENSNQTSSPKNTSLTCQLLKLSKTGWYWGPISREEAEEKLVDQPDGAFLVRDSSADRYLLSLSFRSNGKTLHTRIEHSFGLFSFYSHQTEGFGSIVELIDHSMQFSQSGVFCYSRPRSPGYPAFPVRLTKPISRFTQVRSLQYLCRFVIRQHTRVDNIDKLPLPKSLKGYLEEGHY